MLTGKTIVVIGGDARNIEMMRQLVERDSLVYAVGFEEVDAQIEGVYFSTLENIPANQIDAVILPVSGLDEEGYAESHYAESSPMVQPEFFDTLSENCLVFTGIMTPLLSRLSEKIKIIPLFDRDDVAIYNSIPTAEGALMFAIQHTDFTVHDANVTIIGFGRVGKTLVHTFSALGANVSVCSRNEDELARIFEYHAKPVHIEDLDSSVENCNILVNTVPQLVVQPSTIRSLPLDSLIIDLASKPGGVDFRFAKKRGIKAILAPGLPGMVAPNTAGKILARVIQSVILKQES
ncbi:dipicolinic acid synthetase subunit A [Halalkalibacillus sediminis]|uniref:Dipicolinic acid synthetase subunit A n=1 Tax=Halalkalibacillus sediminis TaxID=2018042 RepID=A0A2I0QYG2_9BACI|nr:dipicolinic acid synthetase subunit A [Halalkalibacillus sediminis]